MTEPDSIDNVVDQILDNYNNRKYKGYVEEIREARKEEDWIENYLINFYTYLPGSFKRESINGKPLGDKLIWANVHNKSNKLKKMTPNQFFKKIDDVINGLPYSINDVKKINARTQKLEYMQYGLPIYLEMRALGFNHYDLTS
jgi:hypothetical protein